jgi:Domain of unknown function (DUF6046)
MANFSIEAVKRSLEQSAINRAKTEIFKGTIPKASYDYDVSPIPRKSKFGNPIFSDLQFENVTLPDGTKLVHEPIDIALFQVRQSKNIVEDVINGLDESIKQFISNGSFEINISVVILGENEKFPREQIVNTVSFLRDCKFSIPIRSQYLNDYLGIYEVVVFDYDLGMEAGQNSKQVLNIFCKSDKPVELIIVDNSNNVNNIV